MRIFVDTNVLAAAFGTRGLCAELLELILTDHDLLVGEVVLAELRRVLRTRFKLPPARIAELEGFLREFTVVPKPRQVLPLAVRDPADRWVLASAVAGAADVLVTGDRDLLDVGSKAPLPILDPRALWTLLRQGSPGAP
ncbi:MAG TPA: putative toxin-antitoxin system toxin component, PIN family [Gemmatimonadales bacterium]|nr:putative toxin-antitoxin system toxin component, PIN family [Gemmatimonadales bacterium]